MGESWLAMAEVTKTLCRTSTMRYRTTVMICSFDAGWEYAFTCLYRLLGEDLSFLAYSYINQLINQTYLSVDGCSSESLKN